MQQQVVGMGQTLRHIELMSGCKVSIRLLPKETFVNSNRTIVLIGNTQSIDDAKRLIDQIIRKHSQNNHHHPHRHRHHLAN